MQQHQPEDPIADMIRQAGGHGGFIVIFPEYRPDRFAALAARLDLDLFDYRREVMSTYGWDADRLDLAALDQTLRDRATLGGILATNVEALLATKPAEETQAWTAGFLASDWAGIVVVPIVVHADLVPAGHPHVHRLVAGALREQSLINRLMY